MKKWLPISLGMVLVLSILSPLGFAQEANQTISMTKALENLDAKGYKIIRNISLIDGYYTASSYNTEGRSVTVSVDVKTGAVTTSDKTFFSALEISKKLEQQGYHDVYKMNLEGLRDQYEIKALNAQGKKVELRVNALTGEIKKIQE